MWNRWYLSNRTWMLESVSIHGRFTLLSRGLYAAGIGSVLGSSPAALTE